MVTIGGQAYVGATGAFVRCAAIKFTTEGTIANTTTGVPTSQTTACRVTVLLDCNAMAAGDQFNCVVYEKVNGGTQRVVDTFPIIGTQTPLVVLGPFTLGEGWDITLKKIAGTDRSIAWSLREDVADVSSVATPVPVSQTYLVRGGPKYIGHFVQFQSRRWREWEGLLDAVRTGKATRERNSYVDSPADLELLVWGLHEIAVARGDARWMAHAIPLERCRTLLDVGGGAGTYAVAFCHTNPALHATVLDLPAALPTARRILKQFDQTARVTLMAGDYLSEPIRGGPYDAALLSNIVHLHDEAQAEELLRRIHAVLSPGGILIVKDYVMEPGRTQPESGALFALTLLLATHGRTHTFAEMSKWIARAGFRDTVVVAPEPPMTSSVLVALRAGPRAVALVPRPLPRAAPDPAARLADDAADWHDPPHTVDGAAAAPPAPRASRRAARPRKKPAAAPPQPVRPIKARRAVRRPR